jgi:hypothetical protein
LEANELVGRQPRDTGFTDRAPPPVEPIARRLFALDLERRPAVSHQQEIAGPPRDTGMRASENRLGFPRELDPIERP